MASDADLILGVHLAAGIAYFALVRRPNTLLLTDPIKMAPSDSFDLPTRLKDFSDRFMQEVRRLNVGTVAVAHPRLAAQWSYANAFDRISLEASIILSTKQAGIVYRSVKQIAEVARAAGISKPDEAAAQLADAYHVAEVKHWKHRSVALMVALAVGGGYT